MISDAIDQILSDQANAGVKQWRREARKRRTRMVDSWLNAVEVILEQDRCTVPEPLFREIGAFLRQQTPTLDSKLRRNRRRDAARVLDVLFEAQEALKHAPDGH